MISKFFKARIVLWISLIVLYSANIPEASSYDWGKATNQYLNIDRKNNFEDADRKIKDAYDNARSDIWVQSQGEVVKVLKDDTDGDRHQRFLLRLSNGHTVLIAHNIDLAPRIEGLKVGDTVMFYGQYVWNNKGGVIHWTHHDPSMRKIGGWLMYQGKRYE
jgi:hypothetical protein